MPINVACHGCGKGYTVPDKRAGHRFKCRDCGTIVSVPADEWRGSGDGFGFENDGVDPAGTGYHDSGNPYASFVDRGPSRSQAGRADALSRTNVCAIFLYITASLSILMHCANIVLTIADPDKAAAPGVRVPANETERSARMAGSLAAGFTILALQVLIIVGASFQIAKTSFYFQNP